MRILLALYLFTFFANATSCIETEEQNAKWDAAYASKFKINSVLNESTYSISVSIPQEIDGQSFNLAGIIIGNKNNPAFYSALKIFEDEGEAIVWFLVKADAIEKHSLILSYGDGCGISINVPVVVN